MTISRIIAAVTGLALTQASPLHAQVQAEVPVVDQMAEFLVANGSTEPVIITVEGVFHDFELRDTVTALIAPRRFELAPHERQIVRIALREAFPPGTVLRIATFIVPRAPSVGLIAATRFNTKLVVIS